MTANRLGKSKGLAWPLIATVAVALLPASALAIDPAFVRTDGDDTLCNGEFDAGAGSAPNCAFATIAKAVTELDAGGEIFAGPGTFTTPAQIVISQDATIIGSGKDVTIIRTSFNTGSSGDARGWFLVDEGVGLSMRDLTLDGTGQLVWQGIRHRGFGEFERVRFTQIKFNPSGPHYAGTAVAAFSLNGVVDFTECMFDEIGRVSVLYFGTGVNGSRFVDSMCTGKGDGDFLDYCVEASAGAEVVVDGCRVSGNRGVASSDNSASAGLLATTFFGPGTRLAVYDSDISKCTRAINYGIPPDSSTGLVQSNVLHRNDIAVLAVEGTTVDVTSNCIAMNSSGVTVTSDALVTVNNNNFEKNLIAIQGLQDTLLDAENNWYNDPTGPGGDGPGTGDPVVQVAGTGSIDFDPFLTAPSTSAVECLCALPPAPEDDCNTNGIHDECDLTAGISNDCNSNGVPDACDIAGSTSNDLNNNDIPDDCEADCNANGTPDDCDIADGISGDCNNDSIPNECQEGPHPGWNWFDVGIPLTANQPTYWSMATGEPGAAGSFPILDPPGENGCPGRPDPNGSLERVLRGYLLAWAVDANGNEIRWNHLKGDAVVVNYDQSAAWEYTSYAFPVVDTAAAHGNATGSAGQLNLDGLEYVNGYDLLLLDFYATGASIYGAPRRGFLADTELALLPLNIDLRQETDGPTTTKASFTVWNQNEVKLTSYDRCVTCWDYELLSQYGAPNHFLVENLHTDKGKAQIDGLQSQLCDLDYDPGDACTQNFGGPMPSCDPRDRLSVAASLVGVSVKHLAFSQSDAYDRSAMNLIGMGTQTGLIQADVAGNPPPERPVDGGTRPGKRPIKHGAFDILNEPPSEPQPLALGPGDERTSASQKGSLLVYPVVELRWNGNGQLIQDTFIDLTNDYPDTVQVQMYFVNGDAPITSK